MKATGPGQPAHLLLNVIELLNRLSVPYAIVGALAVSFHGVTRATKDGDVSVWLKDTSFRPKNLLERIQSEGFQAEMRVGDFDDPIAAVIVISDGFGNLADLLIGVRGMSSTALVRTVAATLLGHPVQIVGAEDLVAMKLAAGASRDLDDVRGIIDVSGEKLDLVLLKELARNYGAGEVRKLASILKESDLG